MNTTPLSIPAGGAKLNALLSLPSGARGLVVFVHGSGSSHLSPRNQAVAERLQAAGLATLLFDLLTTAEAERDQLDASLRFRIDLFRDRVLDCLDWLATQPRLTRLFPVGLFGASSGAAAALQAAAAHPTAVGAVVSRGGRPDLAGEALEAVLAPTLLIVGGEDGAVLRLNRAAAACLPCPNRLVVVPGASHLFEEPGALEAVAALACDWFLDHLHSPGRAADAPHHLSASAGQGPAGAGQSRLRSSD